MSKRLVFLAIIFYLSPLSLLSQQTVKGRVIDTADSRLIENAVVLVLHPNDSTLVNFERTSKTGEFEFKSLPKGDYLLLVSAENYADLSIYFSVIKDANNDLGNLSLLTLEHILQEVVVHQSVSKILIKGDTTEYRADSFHVQTNATVEDLLKVLPGLTVDSKGNITANGKKIKEVLIDGEPFFGDDPILVTTNLRSNMVEKVQVYEKKTDLEQFTGIKSRDPKTVVNLKLKENKKKGFFGNILLGIGANGNHNSQAMLNKFNGKERLSFYGMVTSTGAYGLPSDDISRFSDNSIFSELHEASDPLDTWSGNYDGKGFPLLQTAGLHYNNKWNGDTQAVNTNYKIVSLGIDGKNNTEINQILAGKTYENHNEQSYHNNIISNRVTGMYQFVADSTSTFKLSSDANFSRKHTANSFSSETLMDGNSLVNTQQRNNSFQNDNSILSGTLTWFKKLRKKRRTFSASMFGSKNHVYSSGYIYALNYLYTNSSLVQTERLDQFKTTKSEESNIAGTFSYTEPVSAKATISLIYGHTFYNGTSEVRSFMKAPDHVYSLVDSATTSEYVLKSVHQKLNIQYALIDKSYFFLLGDEFNSNSFDQLDIKNSISTIRHFVYNNPVAQIGYYPNRQSSWSITYQGITTQPAFRQLQPLILNIDPNNKFIGNQNLIPSYGHSITVSHLQFKPVKNQTLQVNIKFTKIENAFGFKSSVDSFARTINQWVNLKGNYSGSFEFLFLSPLPKFKITASMSTRILIDRYGSITNGLLNFVTSRAYITGLSLRKSADKKYNLSMGGNLRYTEVNASILNRFSNSYLSSEGNFSLDVFMARKITFHTDGNILTRQNIAGFSPLKPSFLMNAWVSKKLLSSETLVFKASVNNLFNSNSLNSRYAGAGYTSQTNYDLIERYFLISIAWNFVSNSIK